MSSPALHLDVEPLGILLGTWSGEGHGVYPSIDPFDYEEIVTFSHVGKPFIAYAQRTKNQVDGRALHVESGFVRLPRPDWVELVVSHPTGVAELAEGAFDGHVLRLRSRVVACAGSAKQVDAIERDIAVEHDRLTYEVRMAAVGQPLVRHLEAVLWRVE
ncbi:MAG: FABP family protein [Acidimicrobiales bacterium]